MGFVVSDLHIVAQIAFHQSIPSCYQTAPSCAYVTTLYIHVVWLICNAHDTGNSTCTCSIPKICSFYVIVVLYKKNDDTITLSTWLAHAQGLVLPPKRHCLDRPRPECDELKLARVFRHEERGNSGFIESLFCDYKSVRRVMEWRDGFCSHLPRCPDDCCWSLVSSLLWSLVFDNSLRRVPACW